MSPKNQNKTKTRLSSGTASDPASQIDIGRNEGQRVYYNNKPLGLHDINRLNRFPDSYNIRFEPT